MEQKRHSTNWASGFTIFLMLLIGILIGKGLEKTGWASESYEELQVFAEVLAEVQKSYVEPLETEDLIHGAVRGMLAALDPHSSYMNPDMYKEVRVETKGEFGGLGIQIGIKNHRVTVIAPIEDTPAFAAGIQAGDIIIKVDDKLTKDLTLMESVHLMRGAKGTKVVLTVERESTKTPLVFDLIRDTIKIQSVRSKVLRDRIGYLRITQFQEATPEDLSRELAALREKNIRALILDLRNNPGGLLTAAVGASSRFLESDTVVVSIKGRSGKEEDYRSLLQSEVYSYPMVVLVNQGSASASEILASAMQDWGKALIVGTTTFGKGSVQTILPLSNGGGLRLTTAKYYTPSGKSIHNVGVVPDIIIDPQVVTAVQSSDPKPGDSSTALSRVSPTRDLDGKEKPKTEGVPSEGEGSDKQVEINDVQLQKAIELLTAWKVFKNLNPL